MALPSLIPPIPVFGSGFATDDELNQLCDVVRFLLGSTTILRPIAHLHQLTLQTFTTGVPAVVNFDGETFDDALGHDNAVNNSRYTFVYGGKFLVAGAVGWAVSAAGNRKAWWQTNATTIQDGAILSAGVATNPMILTARTMLIQATIGDYVELLATQTSGGNLNTSVLNGDQSTMSIMFAGA